MTSESLLIGIRIHEHYTEHHPSGAYSKSRKWTFIYLTLPYLALPYLTLPYLTLHYTYITRLPTPIGYLTSGWLDLMLWSLNPLILELFTQQTSDLAWRLTFIIIIIIHHPHPSKELSWVELSWVELSWVELSWVELSWVELSWVELSWVELSWVELSWVGEGQVRK